MGTGGMGDVLAGIIGSMLNQEQDPMNAINVAIYAHSRAGDIALEDFGPGFTPTEVAQRIGLVLRMMNGYK